jgi:arylsulfatase A-like enzyme
MERMPKSVRQTQMVHRDSEVAESRGVRDRSGTKKVRRLTFLLTLCLVTGLAWASTAAPGRPNVVIFLADDLGWGDVGFHGGPIETPHIDRLAREGVELDRFYVTPICSPTRAALMTGRDPIKLGVAYQVFEAWDNHGVHPEERFLSEAFGAAGYQTAAIGKWHLGHAQETYLPRRRGFDHFYGHLNTEVGYFPPFAAQGGKDFQRNGKSVEDGGYETFLLAEEAVRWIRERDKSRPFLLYMPFLAPHTPLDAPEALKAKYAELDDDRKAPRGTQDWSRYLRFVGVDTLRPVYAAVVDGMDQSIGRVLATLDDEGLAEDTIVLFFSDNGGMTTFGVGGADNAPLRGGKGETFEGGIRVVSVIRWPGHLEAGGRMEQIISVMDVFPTLAAAAGIEVGAEKPLDGIDVWPAISEGRKVKRESYLFFASEIPRHGSFKLTAFNEEWKLVQLVEQDIQSTSVQNMLFRIGEDPYEYNDLAFQHPDVVADLSERIHEWRSQYPINGTRVHLMPPPGWRAPKDWATYPISERELQDQPAPGYPPDAFKLRALDWIHRGRGRLIYE